MSRQQTVDRMSYLLKICYNVANASQSSAANDNGIDELISSIDNQSAVDRGSVDFDNTLLKKICVVPPHARINKKINEQIVKEKEKRNHLKMLQAINEPDRTSEKSCRISDIDIYCSPC